MWALYLSMQVMLLTNPPMPAQKEDTGRRFTSSEACMAAAKRETREHAAVTNTATCVRLPEGWL